MRTDFDKQWERRKAWRAACPLDDDELRLRVQRVQTFGGRLNTNHYALTTKQCILATAAACLLAVLLPLGLHAHRANSPIPESVLVEGQQCYFACNNGCSAEGTVEMFKVTFL